MLTFPLYSVKMKVVKHLVPFFICLLPFPILLQGQSSADTAKTLLYKIEKPGTKSPSFIYGTMHTDNDRAFHLMDSVLIGFKKCGAFAMEFNLDSVDATKLAGNVQLPYGVTIDSLLTKEEYKMVNKLVHKQLGLDLLLLNRMKPVFIMAAIQNKGMNNSGDYLDMYFNKLAKKQKKRIIGLEKAEDQMKVFDDLPINDQARMLVESAKHFDEGQKEMEEMVAKYENRDLQGLNDMINKDTTMDATFEANLITKRNYVMAKGIEKTMDTEPVFVAVGAAHLPGEEGIVNILRKKGYNVSPVVSPTLLDPKKVRKQLKSKKNW